MRALIALVLIVAALTLSGVLTACSSDDAVSGDYYENELHHGYPGPGTTDPREGT